MKIDLAIVLASLLVASLAEAQSCSPVSEPGFTCNSREFEACELKVGEFRRQYCIHVPSQGGPKPVIFSFHGAAGKARSMVNLWRSYTEQTAIIVVPQAAPIWTNGDCVRRWRHLGTAINGWRDMERMDICDSGPMRNDLDFVDALQKHVEKTLETSDFYATGFSDGAGFVGQLYLTSTFAKRFSGFAAVGVGLNSTLRAAQGDLLTVGMPYKPNRKFRRPIIFQMGTEDKKTLEVEVLAAAVDKNPQCLPLDSALKVLECVLATPIDPKHEHDMPTIRLETARWLVDFNNAEPRAHESLYPNLGIGRGPEDQTLTVRQDFLGRDSKRSATVSVLTTVNGGHDWPGWGGNRAPCPSENCDIDMQREIIQFFRAHGGMRLPLP